MTYRITIEQGVLRAELANRETVEEMRDFLRAVVRNSARSASILIRVRASKPLFHVERNGLIEYFRELARLPRHRIALLADTPDLQTSHEYLELIARQRGANVRSFRSEVEALLWLKDRRFLADRRLGGDRRSGAERRSETDRRHGPERRRQGEDRRRTTG